jgi:hypothetical protein
MVIQNSGTKPSSWTRRALLGGGFVVGAAALSGVWRGINAGAILPDQSPYEPWQEWRASKSGDPLSLVSAAILASNPHNTQPWFFKVKDRTISVYADPDRNLGAFDPYRRELWHGLGAAIANIEVAAPARGYIAKTDLVPDPAQPQLAAIITLTQTAVASDPLANMIAKRTTNRADYDDEKIPEPAQLKAASPSDNEVARVLWVNSTTPSGRAVIATTISATEKIIADKVMIEDGHRWFRNNPKQVAKYRDGPQAAVSGVSPLLATIAPLLPKLSTEESGLYWLASTHRQVNASPVFGFVMVHDLYDRKAQLIAGAVWQRLHLGLTKEGLAAQPINQAIEWVDRERQLNQPAAGAAALRLITGGTDWKPTFLFRAGYPTRQMPHSARRKRTDVLLS